jgi:hypothetical protein
LDNPLRSDQRESYRWLGVMGRQCDPLCGFRIMGLIGGVNR